MGKNLPETIKIKALRHANEQGIRYKIENIHILGEQHSLSYTQSEKILEINLGKKYSNEIPMCICIDVE